MVFAYTITRTISLFIFPIESILSILSQFKKIG